jgi:RNA polymerase sigma factor (sigma-70 family)
MITYSGEEFEKLKQGDPDQLVHFYNSYKESVYNYLLMKTRGNIDSANELACRVNSEVLESIGKIKNENNLLGWVLRIAYFLYCDHVKESIREREKITEKKKELINEPREESEQDEAGNRAFLISAALKNIKEKYSTILNLKYYEGKSIRDLAGMYNVTEIAIGGMLFRAKEALKKEIEKLGRSVE